MLQAVVDARGRSLGSSWSLRRKCCAASRPRSRGWSVASGPRGAYAGEFSHREVDILEMAASDVPNREIARRLVLSEHTVKWYWKQIFGKLYRAGACRR